MTRDTLVIALAQLRAVPGDVARNADAVRRARAQAAGADVVALPQLFLSGAPLHDLARRPALQDACRAACEALARETADGGPAILVGLPWAEAGHLHDAYALLDGGAIQAVRFAAVVDLGEPFAAGPLPGPVAVRGVRVGIPIGGDLAEGEVTECLAETGAEILLSPAASPHARGARDERLNRAAARVTESDLPLIVLNGVGGADEHVLDGTSFALAADCALALQMPAFREAVTLSRWERGSDGWACRDGERALVEEGDAADYATCMLGLRHRAETAGHAGAVVVLAGDPESALAARMTVDALGSERVRALALPDAATSSAGIEAARACAEALGLSLDVIPVADTASALAGALGPSLMRGGTDALREMARDALIAAVVQATGALAVVAAHRAAVLLGEGPRAPAFNPLRDLSRAEIRRLAALRTGWRPHDALAPAGEVVALAGEGAPDPVEAIVTGLLDERLRAADLVGRGHSLDLVRDVERRLAAAEGRRRVAASGVRLGPSVPCWPRAARFEDSGAPAFVPDPAIGPAPGAARSDAADY
jgi:NAD+ synthase